jgi:hypothetical protein
MSPVTDPEYNAIKQRRYRERLKAREMMMRDSEAAVSVLARAALARAGLNPALQAPRGAAPPLTTTDAAALAATTMALLQILTAFNAGADLLARGLQAHLAEAANRENEAECA